MGDSAESSTGAACLNGISNLRTVPTVLTISRLTRWSIGYYNDTANAAKNSAMNAQAANGGLGEY